MGIRPYIVPIPYLYHHYAGNVHHWRSLTRSATSEVVFISAMSTTHLCELRIQCTRGEKIVTLCFRAKRDTASARAPAHVVVCLMTDSSIARIR